jgi:hypothetical protein
VVPTAVSVNIIVFRDVTSLGMVDRYQPVFWKDLLLPASQLYGEESVGFCWKAARNVVIQTHENKYRI